MLTRCNTRLSGAPEAVLCKPASLAAPHCTSGQERQPSTTSMLSVFSSSPLRGMAGHTRSHDWTRDGQLRRARLAQCACSRHMPMTLEPALRFETAHGTARSVNPLFLVRRSECLPNSHPRPRPAGSGSWPWLTAPPSHCAREIRPPCMLQSRGRTLLAAEAGTIWATLYWA